MPVPVMLAFIDSEHERIQFVKPSGGLEREKMTPAKQASRFKSQVSSLIYLAPMTSQADSLRVGPSISSINGRPIYKKINKIQHQLYINPYSSSLSLSLSIIITHHRQGCIQSCQPHQHIPQLCKSRLLHQQRVRCVSIDSLSL